MATRKKNTPADTPALSLSQLMAAWLGAVDGVETSTADIAARIASDLSLTKDETKFFAPPKTADDKANNRHVAVYDFVYRAVEENIVVKGQRILPATIAALRDKNVNGTDKLQGIPKSVSDVTCWVGQIKVRIRTLRGAVERHLETGGGKTTNRTDKTDPEFMLSHLQAMFNRANKKETFELCDVPTLNAWAEQGAKMMGIKLTKVK